MIFASILSFLTSILTNVLLFFAGRLLINSKKFLLYIGIKPTEEKQEITELASAEDNQVRNLKPSLSPSLMQYKDPKISIEGVLVIIGLLIQWIAIFNIITSFVVTILAIQNWSKV